MPVPASIPPNKPLKRIDWPQDQLEVPDGYGGLPKVNKVNADNTKREAFGLPFKLSFTAWGQSQRAIIPIPQDGDFWAAGLTWNAYNVDNPANPILSTPFMTLSLIDNKSGYDLFRGPVLAFYFFRANNAGDPANTGTKAYTPWWIEPYCFVRDSAMQLTVTLQTKTTANIAYDAYFFLQGWKEYRNAAY